MSIFNYVCATALLAGSAVGTGAAIAAQFVPSAHLKKIRNAGLAVAALGLAPLAKGSPAITEDTPLRAAPHAAPKAIAAQPQ